MTIRFSPSVNILRDINKEFKYFSTPNSERILKQINDFYGSGLHAFNIIGSYGTGKSSFLLALEKQLKDGKKLFNTPFNISSRLNPEFINVIGDYKPLADALAEQFGFPVGNEESFFKNLDSYYAKCRHKDRSLIIVIDEFGKFLEYAAKNNPEKEIYFIQKLAEYVNDSNKKTLLITVLHQNFDSYAYGLGIKQRKEWEKVKGRFKEIAFNEPVEQLLSLAAEYLKNEEKEGVPKNIHALTEIVKRSNLFPLKNEVTKTLSKELYPLDILSAAILVVALQKYGQNERSLFTFLQASDYLGLTSYDIANNYYNISCVYDYLSYHFYSYLNSKYNPDFVKWHSIKVALEKVNSQFTHHSADASKLVKTIGLLNIFSSKGAIIDKEFLEKYAAFSLGTSDPHILVELLEKKKIIKYQKFRSSYILFEGTDMDIELELREAEKSVPEPIDITKDINEYFKFPILLAKEAFYETGVPRYFEFVVSKNPINQVPKDEIDGFINLIFSSDLGIEEIKVHSKSYDSSILFCMYKDIRKIKETIWDLQKVEYIFNKYLDDRVALNELSVFKEDLIEELNERIIEPLYRSDSTISWIWNGKQLEINSYRKLISKLSKICHDTYPDAPNFRNELINRHKIPAAITVARKKFLEALISHWDEDELGFIKEKYPPERTIYLSLVQQTGIHRKNKDEYELTSPTESSFSKIWKVCEQFLTSSKSQRLSIDKLIDVLTKKPFKVKMGFVEFWLPLFLYIKRDDFALYGEEGYIPELNVDIFDLIIKNPQAYYVKAFDIVGVRLDLYKKYRLLAGKETGTKISNLSFIEIIRPFLIFYKELPEYSKNTKNLPKEAIKIREIIKNAKDPEKVFFEDFPQALGYTSSSLITDNNALESFLVQLKESLNVIRRSYDDLVNKFEDYLLEQYQLSGTPYPDYRLIIKARYEGVNKYLLASHHTAFIMRINSEFEDKKSWINSVVHSLICKKLDRISDQEIEIVFSRISNVIKELNNLSEFKKLNISPKVDAFKVEITSLKEGIFNDIFYLSESKEKKVHEIVSQVKQLLTSDYNINKKALIDLLKEELKK